MPGMGRSLQSNNTTVLSAFHSALLHQLLFVLLISAVLAVAFNVVRTIQYRRLQAGGGRDFPSAPRWSHEEPPARRLFRYGFGSLWILDGLLQLQSSMPLGLPQNVIEPSASTSPTWVQHLVNSGVNIWTLHPVQAAAASVWIQIGLGLWLLVAPRGLWSRFGGVASVGWGLVVWVFGEAFGGIFAPGLTWLFGAPGAVLIYCVGGILVALPDRAYATARTGRIILASCGAFLIGAAVLQAWPGRGFWQGRLPGASHVGTLAGMVTQMSQTPQPGILSSWVSHFGAFDTAHGWAVNFVAVALMAGIGIALCTGRRSIVRPAVIAAVIVCLADWVLVEDFGFFGGTGTDPNNMLPSALLIVGGYVAMVWLPKPVVATEPASAEAATTVSRGGPWWEWVTPGYLFRVFAVLGTVVVVLVGAAPMSIAATNPNADPIISQALNGTPNAIDLTAPGFRLVDQRGTPVSLSSLRGHTIALTFLDPVCTSDCPLIAQEFKQADERLGAQSGKVDFVAIVANPIYRSISFTQAFDRQEGLAHLKNWLYLTGSVGQLQRVWNSYGVLVETAGSGAMVAHSDLAFVIDAHGHERVAMEDDPGSGAATSSSFSSLLLDRINLLRIREGTKSAMAGRPNEPPDRRARDDRGFGVMGTARPRGDEWRGDVARTTCSGTDHDWRFVGRGAHGPTQPTAQYLLAGLLSRRWYLEMEARHPTGSRRQRGTDAERSVGRECERGFSAQPKARVLAVGSQSEQRRDLVGRTCADIAGGAARCLGHRRRPRSGTGAGPQPAHTGAVEFGGTPQVVECVGWG